MTQREFEAKMMLMLNLQDAIRKISQEIAEEPITEGGPVCPAPFFTYKGSGDIEMGVRYPEGDKLGAYLFESDKGTFQAGTVYYDEDGSHFDLCKAEIKNGDQAKSKPAAVDDRDIDIMVWEDPFDECYTSHRTLQADDIKRALNPDIEEESERI